jgi:hypothetical protein
MQNDLGIAGAVEAVTETLQFLPQGRMVINLAVEGNNRGAVITYDGLVASAQVDDLEADGAKGHVFRLENSLLIGAPMEKRRRHAAGYTLTHRPVFMREPGYTAHSEFNPHPPETRGRYSPMLRWIV